MTDSQAELTTLQKAQSFDLSPIIARFANKKRITIDRTNIIAQNTIAFLVLCGTTEENWTVTGEVDEFWHEFILFTERYEIFCYRNFKRFIHHRPAEEVKEEDIHLETTRRSRARAEYTATLKAIEQLTGSPIDHTIWPSPKVFLEPQQPQACVTCSGGGNGPPPHQPCGCGDLPKLPPMPNCKND